MQTESWSKTMPRCTTNATENATFSRLSRAYSSSNIRSLRFVSLLSILHEQINGFMSVINEELVTFRQLWKCNTCHPSMIFILMCLKCWSNHAYYMSRSSLVDKSSWQHINSYDEMYVMWRKESVCDARRMIVLETFLRVRMAHTCMMHLEMLACSY